jgi:hypothetical protein
MTMIDAPAQGTASDYIRNVLQQYGLESLTDWAMGAITQGMSADQVMQEMRQLPQFKQRFPAITNREQQGLPSISPGEYVEYERRARQLMFSSGLPSTFYDETNDFTALLTGDVSLSELQDRVANGYLRVQTAPPEVRQIFGEFFGPDSATALAAYFIDPERAAPLLRQQAAQAVFGGAGRQFGVEVDRATTELAAQMNVTDQAAQQGFGQLAARRELFNEKITETADLTAGREGVESAFGMNAASAEAVRRREAERQAAFSGYSDTRIGPQGAAGLGSADQLGR